MRGTGGHAAEVGGRLRMRDYRPCIDLRDALCHGFNEDLLVGQVTFHGFVGQEGFATPGQIGQPIEPCLDLRCRVEGDGGPFTHACWLGLVMYMCTSQHIGFVMPAFSSVRALPRPRPSSRLQLLDGHPRFWSSPLLSILVLSLCQVLRPADPFS